VPQIPAVHLNRDLVIDGNGALDCFEIQLPRTFHYHRFHNANSKETRPKKAGFIDYRVLLPGKLLCV